MRHGISLVALALAVASCGASHKGTDQPGKRQLSVKDIVDQSSKAIVVIEVSGDGNQRGTGSGFILDKSGLIATNFHVVQGTKNIRVKLYGGDTYAVSAIAGFDPGRDLALLRIDPKTALPTLRLGDSDKMSAGDQVVAIGNPLGVFEFSVSSGLISQVRPMCTRKMVENFERNRAHLEELLRKPSRTEAEEAELAAACAQELTLLQISAPISKGSSGGPLFNQAGEVVGVTTLIVDAGQNINFAIPGNYLKPIIGRPAAISLDDFAAATRQRGAAQPDDGIKIDRKVPHHEVTIFDGCKQAQIAELVEGIWGAIKIGAPLYNDGNHEACYRVYEGTATRYEKDPPCAGVKRAFGDGLLRANTLENYKQKAWAMRDTFDGLLDAAERWGAARNTPIKRP